MIKLCVFDVDGTLYDLKSHRILDSTVIALRKLQENGIKIAVATGRCHYGLGKALNDLNFDYILGCTGGVLVDKDWNVLYRNDLLMEDVLKINEFCEEHEAGLVWKFIDHMYVYSHPEKINWYEGQRNSDIGKEPFIDCFEKNRHLVDIPQSASVHVDPNEVKRVFGDSKTLDFVQYYKDGFDVVVKGNNKGEGLRHLSEITGIQFDEMMVFGDNYNDIEMFEVAGNRIAMGNAVDVIKDMATYVTDDCSSDGIYNACKHFNLI